MTRSFLIRKMGENEALRAEIDALQAEAGQTEFKTHQQAKL